MHYEFLSLAGPVIVDGAESPRTLLSRHYGVDPRRITVFEEPPGVVVQPPSTVVHDPWDPAYTSPPKLLEMLERADHGEMSAQIAASNPGLTDWVLRSFDRNAMEFVWNPNPRAVAFVHDALGFMAFDENLANAGAVAHIGRRLNYLRSHPRPLADFYMLSANRSPDAEALWRAYPDLVGFTMLSENPCEGAMRLLGENVDEIDWMALSNNPHPMAIDLLLTDPDRIDWTALSSNPHPRAVDLLLANLDKADFIDLSSNPDPRIIEVLAQHLDRVDWPNLSKNPSAMPLLEANLDRVVWSTLCQNPNAVPLLRRHLTCVDWFSLSCNLGALDLLAEHPRRIRWDLLMQPRVWTERIE